MNTTEEPTTTAEAAFAFDLAGFQADMPIIHKTRTGQEGTRKFKYADITDIVRQCAPALAKHGLVITSRTIIRDGRTILVSTLMHTSGHQEIAEIDVTAPSGNMKTLGSNITYARRYAYGALTGIVTDEDTDAAGTNIADVDQATSQPMATREQIDTLNANGSEVGRIMFDVIGRDDANAQNITRAEAAKLIDAIQQQ